MKLIFIYGPPAVGKTTIGGMLAELTGYRFFFNHLTVPAAQAIFPGPKDRSKDTGYWDLLKRLRLDAIEAAANNQLDVIFTVAYQGAIDDEFVGDMAHVFTERGGAVDLVQLVAPKHVLMERVENKSRKDLHMGKMTDRASLKQALVAGMFETVKYANVLKLDTSELSAQEAAERIVDYFHLPANEQAVK